MLFAELPSGLPELNPDARLGIELEGWFRPSRRAGLGTSYAAQRKKALICLDDAGVPFARSSSKDIAYTRWQVVEERVSEFGHIPEIISPVIADIQGLRAIHRVFVSLAVSRFKASKYCGLHVHVSRKDHEFTGDEQWRIINSFDSQWYDYVDWIAPDRRDTWPAEAAHSSLHVTNLGTMEWKGREAATYADPATMHYIIGIANFTLAAAENSNTHLTDYLPTQLSHAAQRALPSLPKPPVQPAVS